MCAKPANPNVQTVQFMIFVNTMQKQLCEGGMKKCKAALKWCADRFSLARLIMAIVLLALAFAVFAQIKSQQIDEEYKLRLQDPSYFKPVMPRE